jgi:hypothetical protein
MAPWSALPERSSVASADRFASAAHDTAPVRFRDGRRSSLTGWHAFALGARKLRTYRNAAATMAASSRPAQEELEEMARAGSEVAAKRRSRRRGWTWSGIGEARRVESCTSVRRFELGWH